MKKIVGSGMSIAAAIVTLALVGGESAAVAGNGCHGSRNCHGGLLSRLRERAKCHGTRSTCHGGSGGYGAAAGGDMSTVIPFRGDGTAGAAAGGGGQSTVIPFRGNEGQGLITPVNQPIFREPTPSVVSGGVINGGGFVSGGEVFVPGGSIGSGTVIITIHCPGGGQPVISMSNGASSNAAVNGCCDGSGVIMESGVPAAESAPAAAPAIAPDAPAAAVSSGT